MPAGSDKSVGGESSRPVCELLDGVAGAGAQRSIGVSALQGGQVQPPAHCVSRCLGGDPANWKQAGCPFLVAALSGQPDFTLLDGGRCERGLRVSFCQTSVGSRPLTVVGTEDDGAAATPAGQPDVLASASGLIERLEQLTEENAGFANDLLQTYEQLNLIFDLTQQLANVTDPEEIERRLLANVRRVIHSAAVWIDVNGAAGAHTSQSGTAVADASPPEDVRVALAALIAQVRRTSQVGIGELGGRPVVCGPLQRLEGPPDVVVTHCDAGRGVVKAGDLMLVDAVLSFGGQLRCNAALHERLRRTATDVTRALVSAIDKKDHYTSGHSERVGYLSGVLAEELGVSPVERRNIEWSGLLHDIGKIGVPEAILCKPGKLTPEEFEVIKRHPRMGFEILEPIGILQTILDGVLYHHEYIDGTGYPDGLRGEGIPLVARIIHVADIFDALTTSRSYRSGFDLNRAQNIIAEERGTRSDAGVVDALMRLIERARATPQSEFATRFPCVQESPDAVA